MEIFYEFFIMISEMKNKFLINFYIFNFLNKKLNLMISLMINIKEKIIKLSNKSIKKFY